MSTAEPQDVVFVHPDLGIGGAENLVVNAALSLQQRGHKVVIYTAHHSIDHCFQATLPGQPLGNSIAVHGDWLPRSLFGGRFHVICAIMRMVYVSLVVVLSLWMKRLCGQRNSRKTVIVCDIVSHVIPVLRWSFFPVLFYCHYPDKLLCTQRESVLKRIYRVPVDWVEELTTGMADRVVVNSNFTKGVFKSAFQRLESTPVSVLYPAIDLNEFDRKLSEKETGAALNGLPDQLVSAIRNQTEPIMLSVNRFERKKNLALAVEAFAKFANETNARLVMAGGYDPRVRENVEHLEELQELVDSLNIKDRVDFVPSFSDDQKIVLMNACRCVVYTPANEHFGIVPIEAMYSGKPVVAVNSGGPLESVMNNETGFLCDGNPKDFARAMQKLVQDEHLASKMGRKGRTHVASKFSLEAFGSQLGSLVCTLSQDFTASLPWVSFLVLVGIVALMIQSF